LSILHLFEIQRKTSVASLINRWSPSPDLACSTALEALQNLDPIRVLRTCISFPKWRRLEDQAVEKKYTLGTEIYDPVFLILLFTRMLSDNTPAYAFSWVEIFRTNVVSLLIRCMSSNDGKIREIALCQIVGLWRSLEVPVRSCL
jgi:nucleolar pre-ribosomal-associated protein 1